METMSHSDSRYRLQLLPYHGVVYILWNTCEKVKRRGEGYCADTKQIFYDIKKTLFLKMFKHDINTLCLSMFKQYSMFKYQYSMFKHDINTLYNMCEYFSGLHCVILDTVTLTLTKNFTVCNNFQRTQAIFIKFCNTGSSSLSQNLTK